MDREVITIEDNVSMLKAAKKMMDEKNIGTLIAARNKKVWGIVTERDLINVLADGKDLADIKIKDARSTPLITIQSKATIEEAAKIMIMSGGRLIVFEDGKLVGVVTPSEIITSLPECPETLLKIDEFMIKDIVSIDESASVIEAIKLMGDKKVGSVIINRRGKPQSIFTDGDLFLHYFVRGRDLSDPVKNAGSSPLKIIPAGTSVHRTAYILSKEKVKRLPVVKNDKIIGIITARDLVRAYVGND
jgi:CBS domain-containing protein